MIKKKNKKQKNQIKEKEKLCLKNYNPPNHSSMLNVVEARVSLWRCPSAPCVMVIWVREDYLGHIGICPDWWLGPADFMVKYKNSTQII